MRTDRTFISPHEHVSDDALRVISQPTRESHGRARALECSPLIVDVLPGERLAFWRNAYKTEYEGRQYVTVYEMMRRVASNRELMLQLREKAIEAEKEREKISIRSAVSMAQHTVQKNAQNGVQCDKKAIVEQAVAEEDRWRREEEIEEMNGPESRWESVSEWGIPKHMWEQIMSVGFSSSSSSSSSSANHDQQEDQKAEDDDGGDNDNNNGNAIFDKYYARAESLAAARVNRFPIQFRQYQRLLTFFLSIRRAVGLPPNAMLPSLGAHLAMTKTTTCICVHLDKHQSDVGNIYIPLTSCWTYNHKPERLYDWLFRPIVRGPVTPGESVDLKLDQIAEDDQLRIVAQLLGTIVSEYEGHIMYDLSPQGNAGYQGKHHPVIGPILEKLLRPLPLSLRLIPHPTSLLYPFSHFLALKPLEDAVFRTHFPLSGFARKKGVREHVLFHVTLNRLFIISSDPTVSYSDVRINGEEAAVYFQKEENMLPNLSDQSADPNNPTTLAQWLASFDAWKKAVCGLFGVHVYVYVSGCEREYVCSCVCASMCLYVCISVCTGAYHDSYDVNSVGQYETEILFGL